MTGEFLQIRSYIYVYSYRGITFSIISGALVISLAGCNFIKVVRYSCCMVEMDNGENLNGV